MSDSDTDSARVASLRDRLPSRRVFRATFAVLIVLSTVPIATTYVAAQDDPYSPSEMRNKTVEPRDGITVVTSDAFGNGRLIAFAPNGSTLYYNETYPYYHDVDPSPAGDQTVMYVATENLSPEECNAATRCRKSVVERLNLSTGEVTRLWADVRPRRGGSNAIHDVDRIGENRLLVAEIAYPDGVYIVNTTTGTREWSWHAEQNFSRTSGGEYPGDWTHINDVEMLADGRIMVSVRNQDKVIFIDPDSGEIVEEQNTLGEDDNYDILFEAHNPDFINASNGGPAVLVADSENNRVVEYQREDGEWNQTWIWQDAAMEWPRDADRLPNGNTLITDSNSDRILEVNQQGEVVWQTSFPGPYEAERLSTGDESAGGQSAKQLGLESRYFGRGDTKSVERQQYSLAQKVVYGFIDLFPTQFVHALLYAFPAWMTAFSALAFVALLTLVVGWAGLELWWSAYSVDVQRPVGLTK
jgi:hypothetical protein